MKHVTFDEINVGDTYITHYGDRVITNVKTVNEYGKSWIMIYWNKQERNDYGTDCGFAGVELNFAASHIVRIR